MRPIALTVASAASGGSLVGFKLMKRQARLEAAAPLTASHRVHSAAAAHRSLSLSTAPRYVKALCTRSVVVSSAVLLFRACPSLTLSSS